ncbi:MAG TPA: M4 family metallopeptidase, partial [Dehalococcoidales bacterium]|nr:M4 family metallopeptidase [Dehalococcoidales bacterium]
MKKEMFSIRKGWLGVIFSLALCLALVFTVVPPTATGSASADDLPDNLVQELQELTEGRARVSTHAKTGKMRFIGTELSHPIPQPAALKADASPEEAARGFLAEYGGLFGLSNQAEELEVMRSKTLDDGRSFVRFQQVYEDVPVVGGELIVQVNPENDVISANGEVLPDISLDTSPTVDASSAKKNALNAVAREYDLDSNALRASEPALWIYNPIILGMNFNLTTLVWRMEVEPVEMLPIRELVLVDARLGVVALHFNQVNTGKYREVYDNENDTAYSLPGNGPVRTEGDSPSSVDDVNDAYDYTGDTYDFYFDIHGRDSIDDAGMNLISTVRYCEPSPTSLCNYACPCQNAFWNGSQMVFGEGFPQADDVVGHEMTHGVTSYESNLFYYMQSGAINEGFSDIWGEFVDLYNGADDPGDRWLIGEDEPNFGVLRDMSNPPAFNDPDRITSTYYVCGATDYGGVHSNSGVANKAAYLMVDGDFFNGYTVAGFGGDIAKAADLWYEVQTNLFTSASDYADLYDCLQQAAINLGFSSADRQTVKDAVDATEMDQQPTSCPAPEPVPPCGAGTHDDLFFDDLEAGGGAWAVTCITGSDVWYRSDWYAASGQYHLLGRDRNVVSECYIAMAVDMALPVGSTPYLHFNHCYNFEYSLATMWDGGVIEYSTNGGSSWTDAGSLIINNGYDGTISSGYGNPLAGRQAFGGWSNGYISSRLDLSSLAGQSVRFRFGIGTDSMVSADGWVIDDIRIYTCGAGAVIAPTVTTNAATNVEETTATLNGTISNDGGEACQYRFEYDTDSGEPYAYNTGWTGSKTTGQSFSAPITGLNNGTKYYLRAQAKNTAGQSSGSELTFLTKPDAPTSLNATTANSTQINLSWTKGDGAQKTKIQRKEGSYPTNKDDGTQVYFDTGTSKSDTGLTPGTTYYYRAWSHVSGSEQWSDNYAEDSATTTGTGGQPDITVAPTSFNVTLPTNTSHNYTLTISNDGDAALSYNISDRETTGGGSTLGGESPTARQPRQQDGLQDGFAVRNVTGISIESEGTSQWTTNGPYGGYVNSLAMAGTNPDIVYAGTERGVFKTADGGATWTKTGFPEILARVVQVAPGDPDIVCAGTDDGIYKTGDGGSTWTHKGLSGARVNAIAIDSTNSSV